LDIKFEQLQVLPPEGKWKDHSDLTLTVIHATERGTPRGREKIVWKLLNQPAGENAQGSHQDVEVVCAAVENRGVPQDTQIRLQGRGIQTAKLGKTGEPDRHFLRHRVADFLADHVASIRTSPAARDCLGSNRNTLAR
jgi:hypothetical protein